MPELHLLGRPTLTSDDGRQLDEIVSQTKRLLLLAYLTDGDAAGCGRDVLVALFWPELDDEHARNALRQALTMLRRSLGDHVIPADRAETVRLVPGALSYDVAGFTEAMKRDDLAGALALYRGDFLAGVHVSGLVDIERWIEERRIGLRRKAVRAALALAERAGSDGDVAAPVSWAHRAVTMAPHDETAWRKLIELQVRQGNVPAALATYERLCRLLRDDFESEPSALTQQLVLPLRRGPGS